MAKKPAAAAPAATYDDDTVYRVQLKKPIPLGGITLRPCDDVRLKGKMLAKLDPANILSAVAVDAE